MGRALCTGCPESHRRNLREPLPEVGDEILKRDVVEVYASLAPVLPLDRLRPRKHRPRPIADRLVAEYTVKEHAQAPLHYGVCDEEQMAAPELRGESYRHNVRKLGLGEIGDVVVLADNEALASPVGFRVDL